MNQCSSCGGFCGKQCQRESSHSKAPAPSAWRYTHYNANGTTTYQYDTAKPKNCNHPNYTPMFTQGQMMQVVGVLEAELDAIRANNRELTDRVYTLMQVEPMDAVAHRFAHPLALELECVLADRNANWNRAMKVIGEYRSAMNAIHEQHSPTHMGEPLIQEPKR